MRLSHLFLITALFGAGLMSASAADVASDAKPRKPHTGELAPDFLGKDGKGKDVTLSQLKGKVVVISFWASWCGYCLEELPALNHIQNKVGTQYIQVVAINQKEDMRTANGILRQLKDRRFLSVYDRSGAVSASYGVTGLPNLWIIDAEGKVFKQHVGYGEGSFSSIAQSTLRALERSFPEMKKAATP